MNDKDIERVHQEVHTANHIKMYERRKSKQPVDITLEELKVSHKNHDIDRQNEMIKEELKEFINGRGNNDN